MSRGAATSGLANLTAAATSGTVQFEATDTTLPIEVGDWRQFSEVDGHKNIMSNIARSSRVNANGTPCYTHNMDQFDNVSAQEIKNAGFVTILIEQVPSDDIPQALAALAALNKLTPSAWSTCDPKWKGKKKYVQSLNQIKHNGSRGGTSMEGNSFTKCNLRVIYGGHPSIMAGLFYGKVNYLPNDLVFMRVSEDEGGVGTQGEASRVTYIVGVDIFADPSDVKFEILSRVRKQLILSDSTKLSERMLFSVRKAKLGDDMYLWQFCARGSSRDKEALFRVLKMALNKKKVLDSTVMVTPNGEKALRFSKISRDSRKEQEEHKKRQQLYFAVPMGTSAHCFLKSAMNLCLEAANLDGKVNSKFSVTSVVTMNKLSQGRENHGYITFEGDGMVAQLFEQTVTHENLCEVIFGPRGRAYAASYTLALPHDVQTDCWETLSHGSSLATRLDYLDAQDNAQWEEIFGVETMAPTVIEVKETASHAMDTDDPGAAQSSFEMEVAETEGLPPGTPLKECELEDLTAAMNVDAQEPEPQNIAEQLEEALKGLIRARAEFDGLREQASTEIKGLREQVRELQLREQRANGVGEQKEEALQTEVTVATQQNQQQQLKLETPQTGAGAPTVKLETQQTKASAKKVKLESTQTGAGAPTVTEPSQQLEEGSSKLHDQQEETTTTLAGGGSHSWATIAAKNTERPQPLDDNSPAMLTSFTSSSLFQNHKERAPRDRKKKRETRPSDSEGSNDAL